MSKIEPEYEMATNKKILVTRYVMIGVVLCAASVIMVFGLLGLPRSSSSTIQATAAHGVMPKSEVVYVIDRVDGLLRDTAVRNGDIALQGRSSVILDGWMVNGSAGLPVKQLQVLIDGKAAANADYGFARPDVSAYYGVSAINHTGYRVIVPTSHLSKGMHALAFRVTLTSGKVVVKSSGVTLSP
jgi:hypothetical protein